MDFRDEVFGLLDAARSENRDLQRQNKDMSERIEEMQRNQIKLIERSSAMYEVLREVARLDPAEIADYDIVRRAQTFMLPEDRE